MTSNSMQQIYAEINKGVDLANDYFKENGIPANAFHAKSVEITK